MFKSRSGKTSPTFESSVWSDLSSGFYVFLLALPLSLGIAEASGFPAVMGLLTATVGGVLTSWFTGSKLSIKGPAAGLIVIVLGAVHDLGGNDPINGWMHVLLAIFVASIIQIILGLLKLGKWVDLIPPSAIKGMLAAIGVVIFSKQIYILLGIPTLDSSGNSISKPLSLLANLGPNLKLISWKVAAIGIWSFFWVWIWTKVKSPILKAIPSPLIVLVSVIPIAYFLDIEAVYRLRFGFEFSQIWNLKIAFVPPISWWIFLKYVGLFAIIGSLESLLTVNAIHGLKPEVVPDKDKDLISIGLGNMFASLFGGLPMISEVARSTANIDNGAKTHWSNVFHGIFIFLFMIFSSYFNELIPLSALAAMLVMVGIRLASPRVLVELKQIGPEQIWGFSVTLIGCLAIDLLWGLVLGSIAKITVERIRSAYQRA